MTKTFKLSIIMILRTIVYVGNLVTVFFFFLMDWLPYKSLGIAMTR